VGDAARWCYGDLRSGSETALHTGLRGVPVDIAVSPDGKYVYYGRQLQELQGAIRLYRVAVAGGAPDDLNFEIGEELRFRPDGRRLAFTRLEGEADKLRGEIWVMENFLPVAKEVPAASAQKIKK
jgi:Tol biopolymer transport system component